MEENIENSKIEKKSAFWDFIRRHFVWLIGIAVGLYAIKFKVEVIDTIITSVILVLLATGLANVAVYSYTKYKFNKNISVNANALGLIFLGVCFIIGSISNGAVFTFFK